MPTIRQQDIHISISVDICKDDRRREVVGRTEHKSVGGLERPLSARWPGGGRQKKHQGETSSPHRIVNGSRCTGVITRVPGDNSPTVSMNGRMFRSMFAC